MGAYAATARWRSIENDDANDMEKLDLKRLWPLLAINDALPLKRRWVVGYIILFYFTIFYE